MCSKKSIFILPVVHARFANDSIRSTISNNPGPPSDLTRAQSALKSTIDRPDLPPLLVCERTQEIITVNVKAHAD